MNTSRQILLLHSSHQEPAVVRQLAEAITRQGSSAVVCRLCHGQYDHVLDAVASADTVIYWPE